MKIIFCSTGADFAKIKSFGYDVCAGYFTPADMDQMASLGLGCLLQYDQWPPPAHPSIIGYYLKDEPDVRKISIEDQEAEINRYRAFTDLPLYVAMGEQVERKCSLNYDCYMMDIYINNKLSSFQNYMSARMAPHFAKHLYPGKKLIPIIGLYDNTAEFSYSEEQFGFGDFFRSMFRTDDFGTYFWAGDGVTCWGINDRPQYQEWARIFNSTSLKCSWIYEQMMIAVTWVFLKINPLLGKYRVTIP